MLPDNFSVRRIDQSSDAVLANLFEHYLYDMAEWFDLDTNIDGRYAYSTASIWERKLDVFFACAGELPIGFGIVGSAQTWIGEEETRDMHEFFVLRRYRRRGVGEAFASHIWDQYRVPWLVRVLQRNAPALPFWRRAVELYTGTRYREETRTTGDRSWSYFTFDVTAGAADH